MLLVIVNCKNFPCTLQTQIPLGARQPGEQRSPVDVQLRPARDALRRSAPTLCRTLPAVPQQGYLTLQGQSNTWKKKSNSSMIYEQKRLFTYYCIMKPLCLIPLLCYHFSLFILLIFEHIHTSAHKRWRNIWTVPKDYLHVLRPLPRPYPFTVKIITGYLDRTNALTHIFNIGWEGAFRLLQYLQMTSLGTKALYKVMEPILFF